MVEHRQACPHSHVILETFTGPITVSEAYDAMRKRMMFADEQALHFYFTVSDYREASFADNPLTVQLTRWALRADPRCKGMAVVSPHINIRLVAQLVAHTCDLPVYDTPSLEDGVKWACDLDRYTSHSYSLN
jgi:hypothetical protein